MSQQDIEAFAGYLERNGYADDALDLVEKVLIPVARTKGISLWDAAWDFSDPEADPEDERTSRERFLFRSMQCLNSMPSVRMLDIFQPVQ